MNAVPGMAGKRVATVRRDRLKRNHLEGDAC